MTYSEAVEFFESNPGKNVVNGEPHTDIVEPQTNTESSGIAADFVELRGI